MFSWTRNGRTGRRLQASRISRRACRGDRRPSVARLRQASALSLSSARTEGGGVACLRAHRSPYRPRPAALETLDRLPAAPHTSSRRAQAAASRNDQSRTPRHNLRSEESSSTRPVDDSPFCSSAFPLLLPASGYRLLLHQRPSLRRRDLRPRPKENSNPWPSPPARPARLSHRRSSTAPPSTQAHFGRCPRPSPPPPLLAPAVIHPIASLSKQPVSGPRQQHDPFRQHNQQKGKPARDAVRPALVVGPGPSFFGRRRSLSGSGDPLPDDLWWQQQPSRWQQQRHPWRSSPQQRPARFIALEVGFGRLLPPRERQQRPLALALARRDCPAFALPSAHPSALARTGRQSHRAFCAAHVAPALIGLLGWPSATDAATAVVWGSFAPPVLDARQRE
jgi:hypothetical protein